MRLGARIALGLAAACAVGVAIVLTRDGGDPGRRPTGMTSGGGPTETREPAPRAARPRDSAEPATGPGAPAPSAFAAAIETLRAAVAGGDAGVARSAAQSLRALLRTEAAAREAAERALRDPALASDLRGAIALVLGTLPGSPSDPALLAALDASPDPVLERCLLLALGARECDDDDEVFEMGDRPWGAHGPGGLGITVRRVVADPATRAAVASRLGRPDATLREAAAVVLRHTTAEADVRSAFSGALRRESQDDVALVLGESLAAWARQSGDPAERAATLSLVLDRAATEGFDAYRLRVENDLERAPLSSADRAFLARLADSGRPFGDRAFALTVLARASSSDGADAEGEAKSLLRRTLAGDSDAAARDLAANLLGRMPPDDVTAAALAKSSRDDAAWNVRHTAVTMLGRMGERPGVRAALEAAAEDDDSRVAEAARESLGRLGR